MIDITRRRALLLALSAPLFPYAAKGFSEEWQEPQHKMPEDGNVHWTGNE